MKVGTLLSQLQLESHFCLRCPHFYLLPVCTAIRCLRSIPGFPLQLFTSILLYHVLWLIVHCCCWLFISSLKLIFPLCIFSSRMETLRVLLTSVLMPLIWTGDLTCLRMTVWPDWCFWPFISWILCFLNAFWWRQAVPPRIKSNIEHKSKWATCSIFFHNTQLSFAFSTFWLSHL